jgi:hypothetical protein
VQHLGGVLVLPGGRVALTGERDAEPGEDDPAAPAYIAPSRIGAWPFTLIAYTSDDGSCGLSPSWAGLQVMRASSGNVAAMMPRAARIPPAVMK